MQRMKAKANAAYLELLKANPKDRAVFNKVRKFSSENESPFMGEILATGYIGFPEDLEIKRSYAASLGKTARALAIYQEILAKETDVKVLARAVDIAVTLQQTAAAAQLLEKWQDADPKDPKVWEQALAVHTQLRTQPKMIEDLEPLTRLHPERKELVLQLGRHYEENRQPEKAVDMYKRSLALEPKNKAVQLKLIAPLSAGNRQGELREALLGIEKDDPAAHEAQFRLAQLYLAENDKDRA
jgi:tetratricopeptide (TPR) repeat protein